MARGQSAPPCQPVAPLPPPAVTASADLSHARCHGVGTSESLSHASHIRVAGRQVQRPFVLETVSLDLYLMRELATAVSRVIYIYIIL